jgi:hypothetical protein
MDNDTATDDGAASLEGEERVCPLEVSLPVGACREVTEIPHVPFFGRWRSMGLPFRIEVTAR